VGLHRFYTEVVTCHPGVTKDQLLDAMSEVAMHNGWTQQNILDNDVPYPDFHQATISQTDDGRLTFFLSTCGETAEGYLAKIQIMAQKLNALCEPAMMVHIDEEDLDEEDSKSEIWIGEGEALRLAQRNYVFDKAIKILSNSTFISDAQFQEASDFLKELAQRPDHMSDQERPRG